MNFTVVIPARYASTRLPGKPLAVIAGQTMIQRVYARASESSASQVVVATDDERIFAEVKSFGGRVEMTDETHVSGTDRIAQIGDYLRLDDEQIIVNVQGDEPFIPSEVINQVANNLADNPGCAMATLCEPINTVQDYLSPSVVKVCANEAGEALYFSRSPIPYARDQYGKLLEKPASTMSSLGIIAYRHIGIYAYRVGLLRAFKNWQPSKLELLESLEQLRVLDNGHRIHIAPALREVPAGVDTPEDLQRVRDIFGEF